MVKRISLIVLVMIFAISCSDDSGDDRMKSTLTIASIVIGTFELEEDEIAEGVPIAATIELTFSSPVALGHLQSAVTLKRGTSELDFTIAEVSGTTFTISPSQDLRVNATHSLVISDQLVSSDGDVFDGAAYQFKTEARSVELVSVSYNGIDAMGKESVDNVPLDLDITLAFSSPVDMQSLATSVTIGGGFDLEVAEGPSNSYSITPTAKLPELSRFVLTISDNLMGANGDDFSGFAQQFYTRLDSTLEFPEISDEDLLTKIQRQTFKYFWDFGHPVSRLARERNTSGETVTSGGSGFGLMTILVGIERGFITRQEGIDRLDKIVTFLGEEADRFHGAWPHWLNGTTGDVIPFSTNDDGGDLVETAFMVQGLLTVRQYLDAADTQESAMIDKINALWHAVEWDWYTQGGQNVLYWHWSPNHGWDMNHKITGWNEALIVYVLAASSPTHSIDATVYTEGWAGNGAMKNTSGNVYYGYTLDLRSDMGGPLFFSHYSFLGLDPRNLSDQFANYWDQNVNHSLINRAYCVDNPKNYLGYKPYCWGLTASDGNTGYSAHSPDNDKGVITPTAGISSIPYTPEESMEAIRHFYYILGDRLWGEYGFYDAFNLTENWTASSYLAIDQGPIIVMIENYRTGLLWDLFMSAPEVQTGLDKLGFSY